MKYRVHAYLTVRVPFDVEADSQTDAIAKARERIDGESFRSAEAEDAEEVTGFLVDEDGDPEYARSRTYDAKGRREGGLLDAFEAAMAEEEAPAA